MTFMFLLHRPHVYFLSYDFVIICNVIIIIFVMSSLNFVAWIMEHIYCMQQVTECVPMRSMSSGGGGGGGEVLGIAKLKFSGL